MTTTFNSIYIDRKEILKIRLEIYFLFFIISLLFYRNVLYAMIFSLFSYYVSNIIIKDLEKKRKRQNLLEFKEFINIYAQATLTGDEALSALGYAYFEYDTIAQKSSIFKKELDIMMAKLSLNKNICQLFMALAQKLDIREIKNFASSLNIAYKTTGNINDILIEVVNVITKRIELDSEIKNMFYEKKYELKIILIVPILIYLFLTVTANEYLSAIYKNISGYFVITLVLIILEVAYILGEKIIEKASID